MITVEEAIKSGWQKTTEANRWRKIYMCAIDKVPNIDWLDPPPTDKEKADYVKMCEEMRATEAAAEAKGQKMVWEIPADLDYD